MAKYAIWDKKSDIFTLGRDAETGKSQWSAAEYILRNAPWAARPEVKIIVGGGVVNGTVFMEFDSTVEHYKRMGVDITDGMTDEEALKAIEEFESNPMMVEPSTAPEERLAAAIEFQNLMNFDLVSPDVVEANLTRGLWDEKMAEVAVQKGRIKREDFEGMKERKKQWKKRFKNGKRGN